MDTLDEWGVGLFTLLETVFPHSVSAQSWLSE